MKKCFKIVLAFDLGIKTAIACYAIFGGLYKYLKEKLKKAEANMDDIEPDQRSIQNKENKNERVRIKGFCAD